MRVGDWWDEDKICSARSPCCASVHSSIHSSVKMYNDLQLEQRDSVGEKQNKKLPGASQASLE